MIAITGASGHLGKATLTFLLQKTDPRNIVAIVRDAQKLQEFSNTGIQIRVADYDDPISLNKALQGVQQLVQISTSSIGDAAANQERNVVQAAQQQGVQHIVYTSTVQPAANMHFLSAKQCLQTEQDIIESGMQYTFFRNSMYQETIPQFIGNALAEGDIRFPAGTGKVSFVSRMDIAEALSIVLTGGSGHHNKQYDITGSAAFSFGDIATMLSAEKNVPLVYTDVARSELQEVLESFQMPAGEISWFLTLADSVKANEFAYVSDTLEKLLGRKPVALEAYLRGM